MRESAAMAEEPITLSPRARFRAAMLLAIVADAVQIIAFPLFLEGAYSPLDDVLDFAVAALLVNLLGWHWEFLPSFAAKLVRSEEHTSELQSQFHLVCRLLLEKKNHIL